MNKLITVIIATIVALCASLAQAQTVEFGAVTYTVLTEGETDSMLCTEIKRPNFLRQLVFTSDREENFTQAIMAACYKTMKQKQVTVTLDFRTVSGNFNADEHITCMVTASPLATKHVTLVMHPRMFSQHDQTAKSFGAECFAKLKEQR